MLRRVARDMLIKSSKGTSKHVGEVALEKDEVVSLERSKGRIKVFKDVLIGYVEDDDELDDNFKELL